MKPQSPLFADSEHARHPQSLDVLTFGQGVHGFSLVHAYGFKPTQSRVIEHGPVAGQLAVVTICELEAGTLPPFADAAHS